MSWVERGVVVEEYMKRPGEAHNFLAKGWVIADMWVDTKNF